MKVAFFDDRFFEVYGAQENVLMLAELLRAEGDQPLFVTTFEGPLAEAARDRSIETLVVEAPPRLRVFEKGAIRGGPARVVRSGLSAVAYSRKLHSALEERGVDLVVAAAVRASLLLLKTRTKKNPRVVLFAQNSTPFGVLAAASLPGVDVLAPISSAALTTFPSWSLRFARSQRPLASGRDLGAFETARAIEDSSELRIVSVGSLTERKGFHVLLEAVRVLVEQGHEVQLKIVGGTSGADSVEYAETLRDFASSNGITVEFVGWQDDVLPYLQWANCFALASSHEGLPGVILEAMASGLPVISTDAGGCRDVVTTDTGEIVPVGDPHTFANALARLREPGLRYRLGQNARQQMLTSYSEAAFLGRFREVVSAAATERPRGSRR